MNKLTVITNDAVKRILPLCDNINNWQSLMEKVNQLVPRELRAIALAKRQMDNTTKSRQ